MQFKVPFSVNRTMFLTGRINIQLIHDVKKGNAIMSREHHRLELHRILDTADNSFIYQRHEE